MSDLIVTGFEDVQTAFLARAALARLQAKLSLHGYNVVVITREEDGRVHLCESIEIGKALEVPATFWATLVNLILSHPSSAALLATIGIDTMSGRRLAELLREGASALLALVDGPAVRDEVLGVLRGFEGKSERVSLKGEDQDEWRRALSDVQPVTGTSLGNGLNKANTPSGTDR